VYTLIDYGNFGAEQKKELVQLCNRRIEELTQSPKIEEPNYWKIAPGEKAENWKEQKSQGIIAIGWNDLGDLTGIGEEEIRKRIKEKYPSAVANIGPQFKYFTKIKRGDIIVANKGMSKVVGIGKVIGDYQYKPEQEDAHTYPVEWFWTTEKEIPFQSNWFVTVVQIPVELYKTIISPKQPISSRAKLSSEIEELIKKFDKDPESYCEEWKWQTAEQREAEHSKFVTKFPINELENLKIDDYVQGKPDPSTGDPNRDSFCYVLEHDLQTTGSIPGPADKFGIYFDKANKEYVFSKDFSASEEAFKATKHDVFSIVDAGRRFQQEKNWEDLSEINDTKDHQLDRHVRSKLLAVYFPNSFLAIHSTSKINDLLEYFKIPKTKLRKKLTLKQFKLVELKDSHPIMKDWDVYKYSSFLFNVVLPLAGEDEPPVDEPPGEEKIDYSIEHLPTPSLKDLIALRKTIKQKILIDDDKLEEIIAALVMGKSVLLTGAVGTGKTHLATILPQIAWKEYGGYYSMVYTATSDWTTQNVIGGIYPKVDADKKIIYDIQKGCVANTVSKNWKEETSKSNERESFEAKNIDDDLQKFKGVWLVIDEFNRANIDKAFGQLFTALEYKNLQIPTLEGDEAFEELTIPEDYRIIGTLNTADKHYLHSLSDALKRRFAIIEIPIPKYSDKDKELYFVVSKAMDGLDITANLVLSHEEGRFVRGKGDSDAENIVDTLYTLMTFVREIKPLGTALLISMLRYMIVNHALELVENKKWDSSLDSALVTSIIPQIEDLNYWTLKVIRAVLCDKVEDFFQNDQEIKDDGHEKYKNDFKKIVNGIGKIRDKKRNKIIRRFSDGKRFRGK
jgi:MoxR-like ATPase